MAKIVCLFPRPEMQQQAEKIAKNYRLDFLYMKAIKSTDVEMEAESAQKAGAEIIIARGIQATIIRKRVSIPVVEMLITGLEMAQLIILARSMAGKLRPIIGIVSFANMICDTSSFDKLYDVSLREYYVDSSDQLIASVELAHKDGVDAVIGGDVVFQYAKDNGIPSVFLMSGVESVAESFRIAERVSYAIDLEKKNSAELKTLLDNSFCGIIKTDSSGAILRANYFAEKLLGKAEQEIIGRNISDLVPPISSAMLESVLLNEQEVYSTAFMIHKTAVVANMAPILMEGRAQGAILSFNEGQKIAEMEREIRREIYRKGYIANKTFEYFVAQ
ncbi:MAG: PrpR N-terminal domain-containing protein, partial [Defluviitaleaceae bacterium]|nr:PrpR N-terminal domain-containing protein [Defluviitaleaceae bacterium]